MLLPVLLASTALHFRLLLAADLLHAILGVLFGPAGSTIFDGQASTLLPVLRLELFHLVEVVVDEPEACAATTTERGVESKELDALRVMNLVHSGKLLSEISLRDI